MIKRSLSPYASPIVIVPRKCSLGSSVQELKRLSVNYRKLNAKLPTVSRNKFLRAVTWVDISRIDEILAWLHSSKFFTSLNLRSGYYHIKLRPQERHENTFTTIFGKFEFLECLWTSARVSIFHSTEAKGVWYFQWLLSFTWMVCCYMILMKRITLSILKWSSWRSERQAFESVPLSKDISST